MLPTKTKNYSAIPNKYLLAMWLSGCEINGAISISGNILSYSFMIVNGHFNMVTTYHNCSVLMCICVKPSCQQA